MLISKNIFSIEKTFFEIKFSPKFFFGKSMKIKNFENSGNFRSYGTTFWHRLSKVSELFSKIEYSNHFGIFTVERYMLIVLGKIAKRVLRRLEVFVKYEDVFS